MKHEELVKRINELAKKHKKEGLTDSEKKEREKLRKEFLSNFRKNFKERLENITFVDEDGNEIKRKK